MTKYITVCTCEVFAGVQLVNEVTRYHDSVACHILSFSPLFHDETFVSFRLLWWSTVQPSEPVTDWETIERE
jgi:hypothetical protein